MGLTAICPTTYEIIVLNDRPILAEGKYNKCIRLGLSDLEIDISEMTDWTLVFFRRSVEEDEFKHIFILSNGTVYVDGVLDTTYDVSFVSHEGSKITIGKEAIDIDELLIMPYLVEADRVKSLTESTFYDQNSRIALIEPRDVYMSILDG